MKRITAIALILTLTALIALTGCGQQAAPVEETTPVNPYASKLSSEIYAEAQKINPEGKTVDILLVIDMQKDFVDGVLGTAEAQAIVPAVVAKIEEYKAKGGVIIATKDTHDHPREPRCGSDHSGHVPDQDYQQRLIFSSFSLHHPSKEAPGFTRCFFNFQGNPMRKIKSRPVNHYRSALDIISSVRR